MVHSEPSCVVQLARSAYVDMLTSIMARPPESGGILLGPVGTDVVTGFFFDAGGSCSSATYSPDYVTLREKMQNEWLPRGVDMKGFAHSHPDYLDTLSAGDLHYVNRLLDKNTDMRVFVAPIIIPTQFRFRSFVVPRNDRTPVEALLELI